MSAHADPGPDGPDPLTPPDTASPDLASPDDPAVLLLGKGVRPKSLTEPLLDVYRSWWTKQASPATCRLTAPRVHLLAAALADYAPAQLVAVVELAYTAPVADDGLPEAFARSWRGESGTGAPGLEMLLRAQHLARNVEMAGRWRAPASTGHNGQQAPTATGPPAAPAAPVIDAERLWQEIPRLFAFRGDFVDQAPPQVVRTDAERRALRAGVDALGGHEAVRGLTDRDRTFRRREFIAAASRELAA